MMLVPRAIPVAKPEESTETYVVGLRAELLLHITLEVTSK
jgi:hypothetical protein